MLPLGRIFEAPSLTPEEQALKAALPNKGPLSPYKTKAVEYRMAMNG